MSLQWNHKEANTRLLLYTKASCDEGNNSIVLVCKDTNVFILALSTLQDGVQNVYQKRGGLTRMRYANLTEIGNVIGESMCKSLPRIHIFTDCDEVSSFAGKDKLKAYKNVQEKDSNQETFSLLGSDVSVSRHLFRQYNCFIEMMSWYCSTAKNLPGNGILSWWVACLLHCIKLEKIFVFKIMCKMHSESLLT